MQFEEAIREKLYSLISERNQAMNRDEPSLCISIGAMIVALEWVLQEEIDLLD